jgi:tetratricopeptide (TPR) repeat protein
MQHKTNSISKFVNFLFIIAVFGVLTTAVNAQYGNLISKKAADALAEGNPQPCDDEMVALIKADVNNPAAQIERVTCYFVLFNDEKYVEALIKISVKAGKTEAVARTEIENSIAESLREMNALVSLTISLNAKYAPAYNMRGMINRYERKMAEAEKDYTRAIELDPKDWNPLFNRGNLRDDLGNTAGAIADYEKVVALGINDSFITKRLPELKAIAAKSGNSSISEAEMNKCVKDVGEMLAKTSVKFTKQQLVETCKESIPKARQMVKDITENPDSFNKSVEAVKNASKTSGEAIAMAQLLNTSQEISRQVKIFLKDSEQASAEKRKELNRNMIATTRKALDELIKIENSYQNFTPEQKQTIGKYKNYYTGLLESLNNLGK